MTACEIADWTFLEKYPFAEGIVCLGFFLVYLLEELGEHFIPAGKDDGHHHHEHHDHGDHGETTQHQHQHHHHHHHHHHPAQDLMADRNSDLILTQHTSISNQLLCESSTSICKSIALTDSASSPTTPVSTAPIIVNDAGKDSHGHSHAAIMEKPANMAAALRGLMLVFALSFHSVFEGMAIGLQPNVKDVWFLFGAVTVHELAIMFCLGLEMLTSNIGTKIYAVYIVILSLITPLGVAVGLIITEFSYERKSATHSMVVAVLQGVAAGALLYVTFLEVLERERRKHGFRIAKYLAVLAGFCMLTLLETAGQNCHVQSFFLFPF